MAWNKRAIPSEISLVDSIEELPAVCSNGDQMWELGFNAARTQILRLISKHECEHEYIGHSEGIPYCRKCGAVKLQKRKIPVLDDEELKQLLNRHYTYWKAAGSYNFDLDGAIEELRTYLATREPVLVSLEKCAAAFTSSLGDLNSRYPHNAIKAVLDAAGMKYDK